MRNKIKLLKQLALETLFGGSSDTTPPTIIITSTSSGAVAGAFTCTFTLSKVSTDFALEDITVSANAGAGTFSGSGTSYTAVITPTAAGTVTVDVAAGAFHDGAGNANTAAAQFSIVSLYGAKFWYDFSDLTTLFQDVARTTPITADGQAIQGLADKSGNNNHASQTTTDNAPLYKANIQNAHSVARFDGINDWLSITGSTVNPFTMFTVCNPANATLQVIAHTVGNVGREMLRVLVTNVLNVVGSSSSPAKTGTTTIGANMNIFAFTVGANPYPANFYINGVADASGETNIATFLNGFAFLGAYKDATVPFSGDIAEVLFFDSVLAEPDRTSITNYLNTRWAVF